MARARGAAAALALVAGALCGIALVWGTAARRAELLNGIDGSLVVGVQPRPARWSASPARDGHTLASRGCQRGHGCWRCGGGRAGSPRPGLSGTAPQHKPQTAQPGLLALIVVRLRRVPRSWPGAATSPSRPTRSLSRARSTRCSKRSRPSSLTFTTSRRTSRQRLTARSAFRSSLAATRAPRVGSARRPVLLLRLLETGALLVAPCKLPSRSEAVFCPPACR